MFFRTKCPLCDGVLQQHKTDYGPIHLTCGDNTAHFYKISIYKSYIQEDLSYCNKPLLERWIWEKEDTFSINKRTVSRVHFGNKVIDISMEKFEYYLFNFAKIKALGLFS